MSSNSNDDIIAQWAQANGIETDAATACAREYDAQQQQQQSQSQSQAMTMDAFLENCAVALRMGLQPTVPLVVEIASLRQRYADADAATRSSIAEAQFVEYELSLSMLQRALQARQAPDDVTLAKTTRFRDMFATWRHDPAEFCKRWADTGAATKTTSFAELMSRHMILRLDEDDGNGDSGAEQQRPAQEIVVEVEQRHSEDDDDEEEDEASIREFCSTEARRAAIARLYASEETRLLAAAPGADVDTQRRIASAARRTVRGRVRLYGGASFERWWTDRPTRAPMAPSAALGVRLLWLKGQLIAFDDATSAHAYAPFLRAVEGRRAAAAYLDGLVGGDVLRRVAELRAAVAAGQASDLLRQNATPVAALRDVIDDDDGDGNGNAAFERGALALDAASEARTPAEIIDVILQPEPSVSTRPTQTPSKATTPLTNWPAVNAWLSSVVEAERSKRVAASASGSGSGSEESCCSSSGSLSNCSTSDL